MTEQLEVLGVRVGAARSMNSRKWLASASAAPSDEALAAPSGMLTTPSVARSPFGSMGTPGNQRRSAGTKSADGPSAHGVVRQFGGGQPGAQAGGDQFLIIEPDD